MRVRPFVIAAVVLGLGAHAPQARALGLTMGFGADPALTASNPASDSVWIPRAAAERARIVRVNLTWSQVAPTVPPPSFVPGDPSSPGYNWTSIDATVRDLASQGLEVLLNIWDAPTWAQDSSPPPGTTPGSWRPDPAQFASFATAAALRYDGRFPDPLHPGAFLPRVRYWQPWNEPNLAIYLSPQWTSTAAGWAPASPVIYRQLLNAFYGAVKRVFVPELRGHCGNRPLRRPAGRPAYAPGRVRSRPVLP